MNISMNMINWIKAVLSGGVKGHFGQYAEDVLIRKLFPRNQRNGVYLDLGAYHPFIYSNTAYFWLKGWTGFNVDANSHSIKIFRKIRPLDVNILSAIIPESEYKKGIRSVNLMLPESTDYRNGISATGTISKDITEERKFFKSQTVPAISISNLIDVNNISSVDYLNIDIEGYDELILKEINFTKINPKVVSIEDYSNKLSELVKSKITVTLENYDYILIGRSGPTSIFLKN